jgi:hypothetical protein
MLLKRVSVHSRKVWYRADFEAPFYQQGKLYIWLRFEKCGYVLEVWASCCAYCASGYSSKRVS